MREIKFRGKVDGLWWHATFNDSNEGEWGQFWALVSRATVGQWTGLRDKNDKEIYEGDIIGTGRWMTEVKFGLFSASELDIADGYEWEDTGRAMAWSISEDDARKREILGNIYDNPELIKKEAP